VRKTLNLVGPHNYITDGFTTVNNKSPVAGVVTQEHLPRRAQYQANLNGSFMKNFMSINYHSTSPILLMWQGIYEDREERVSSYVRGVPSP
jgi:hypothetical protein